MVSMPAPCYFQREFSLQKYSRGCHLVTDEIVSKIPEIKEVDIGIFHLFLKHTSASIQLNENYDPDVQYDMEKVLNRIVPEDNKLYKHTSEGKDDMPAHAKQALIGLFLFNSEILDEDLILGHGKEFGYVNTESLYQIFLKLINSGSFSRNLVATIQGQCAKSKNK